MAPAAAHSTKERGSRPFSLMRASLLAGHAKASFWRGAYDKRSVASELGVRVRARRRSDARRPPRGPEGHKRYILLNKPAGYLSAMSDPEGRPLASDLLKEVEERVYNVGRLDQWSSGLLLFTNDGELASLLVHPSGGIEKEYEIVADAIARRRFHLGLQKRHRDRRSRVSRNLVSSERDRTRLRAVLVEGKNREIRRVLERFGRRAKVLRRVEDRPVDDRGPGRRRLPGAFANPRMWPRFAGMAGKSR